MKRSQSPVSRDWSIETGFLFHWYNSSEHPTFDMLKGMYIPGMYIYVVVYMYKHACMRTHIYVIWGGYGQYDR